MTEETAHIEETEPGDVAETAPSGEESAEDERKEKLESYYKRLPKIISQIRIENNEGVRQNALDSLLRYFEQINELEQSLLPAGETFHPLTLSRVYELAVSGGGADGEKAKQYEEANKAFAAENEILAKTVESLSFRIESMRKQAVDELIGAGKISRLPLDDLKSALADVAGTVDRIEKSFTFLRLEEGASAKPLDEEFLKALRDSDDLTPDLLKSADGKVTYLGKLIRKAGFAYDYRDTAAVRALIGASLGANRRLAETIETLAPAKEQVGKIQKIIALIDAAAGHEERQGPQYREAIEEIGRLQSILSSYRDKNGELEELDAAIRKRGEESAELVQTISQDQEKLERQKKRIKEQQDRIAELRKSDDFKALEKANEDLKEKVEGLKISNDLLEKNKEDFQQEIERLEREKKKQASAHKSEIAAMANRMRMTESGLLAEKLEAEVGSLRKTAAEAHDGIEKEREMRKAVEERVGIWLESEEKLRKDAGKWRKRAALKYAYAAAACGVTAFLGFEAGIFSMDAISNAPLTAYSIVTLGVPAFITSFFDADDLKDRCGNALLGALLGAAFWVGGFVPMVLSVDSELKEKDSRLEEAQKNFLKDCGEAPCRLVKDAEGNYTVEIFARKYKDGKITFDFTKKDAPVLTHTQKIPLTGAIAPGP